jgi:predicted MFS family arabinose efflux permease
MLLLVIHGIAGVFWQTASQLLLHDIVQPAQLQSAVRLNATARYMGMLAGPAVGGVLLTGLGAIAGIFVNTVFYLPLLLWLIKAPYGPKFRAEFRKEGHQHKPAAPKKKTGWIGGIVQTLRDVGHIPAIISMTLLAGAVSFFIGNSYQAQMPGYAQALGHGDPGLTYSMLLGADACGALLAGILLETVARLRPHPRTAMLLALVWSLVLAGFAATRSYPLALALLFVAGFLELSFSSMAQTLVQLNAPAAERGRVIGLYNMSALGLRTFSGVMVGIVGSGIGAHASLALSAFVLLVAVGLLLARYGRSGHEPAHGL